MDQIRGDGGSAIRQPLQAAEVVFIEFWKLDQKINHRRHEHGVRDTFTLNRRTKTLRVELRNRDLARSKGRRRKHQRKIHDVKHGCRVKIDAAFFVRHPVVQEVNVGQDVGVRQRNTLGMTGRAAGVDQCQRRFGIVNRFRSRLRACVQRLFVQH